MARTHKYAQASAVVTTGLETAHIAQLCEAAAKKAETIDVIIRLEESSPGRLVYSARNRLTGGRVEFMTFQVALQEEQGHRKLSTRILTYKVKRQWILIVPLPWQMIAWNRYKVSIW